MKGEEKVRHLGFFISFQNAAQVSSRSWGSSVVAEVTWINGWAWKLGYRWGAGQDYDRKPIIWGVRQKLIATLQTLVLWQTDCRKVRLNAKVGQVL